MTRKTLPALMALLLAVLACNFPGMTTPPVVDPGTAMTAIVQTIQATVMTAVAATTVPTQGPPPTASSTLVPTQPAPTQPVPTLQPTKTKQPTPTNTPIPCNVAKFIEDVNYPDNSEVEINQSFTKTWKLQNVGTCTWNSNYMLVFTTGDRMDGNSSQPLTNGTVAPGQTVNISVDLKAPATPGTYRGDWKLREPGGAIFSLTTGKSFWVQIKAIKPNINLPDWPTLNKGDKTGEVRALQYLLNSYGNNLTVDGIFGNSTLNAVKHFQQQNGLKVDGIVGPKTWTKLVQGKQLSSGMKGDAVRAAQFLLSKKYGYGLAVDGIFGPDTKDTVKSFQKSKGLQVDGIVGPQTWQALFSY